MTLALLVSSDLSAPPFPVPPVYGVATARGWRRIERAAGLFVPTRI